MTKLMMRKITAIVLMFPLGLINLFSPQETSRESEMIIETETEVIEYYVRPSKASNIFFYLEKHIEEIQNVSEQIISTSWEPYSFIPLDYNLQREIYKLCEEYEIAYDLIMAVIKTESEFVTDAVGDNGNSIGLMQIQPKWWQELAAQNNLDINVPADNVHLGIIILTNALNDNAGDLDKALKQYNSGNPNTESETYINKVYANMQLILEGGFEQ